MNLKYRAGYNMWRLCPYNDSREKFYTSLTHSIYLTHWKIFPASILIHFWKQPRQALRCRFWLRWLLLIDCAMLILYKNAQFDHIKSPLSLRLSELIYCYHIKYIIKYTKWYNINLTKLRKLKTNPICFDE